MLMLMILGTDRVWASPVVPEGIAYEVDEWRLFCLYYPVDPAL